MPRLKRLVPSPRRHLQPADIDRVVMIIDGWHPGERIAWEKLADKVQEILGHRWTRQALERSSQIKRAYLASVAQSRPDGPRKEVEPAEVMAKRRMDASRNEIAELKRKLAAYEELFVRYTYNANAAGITPGQLAAVLPSNDRGRSDEERPAKGR